MPSDIIAITTAALASFSVSGEDIVDEQADEIEAMESSADLDDCQAKDPNYIHLPAVPNKRVKLAAVDLMKTVEKASEHVIVPGTLNEYRTLWDSFIKFCMEEDLICNLGGDKLDQFWRGLPAQLPLWIAAWIMSKADDIDIHTGKPKDPAIPRVTYARAQKMRAAISHKFGREYKLGTQQWTENPVNPGVYSGNPSLSILVCQYMVSLRRRKVRAGEIVTSARAMDEETMKKLWIFNQNFPREDELKPNPRKRKHEDPTHWAGYKVRQMLQALYTISMLCLLRYDEALGIMWSDIRHEYIDGTPVAILSLRFRKTDQTGGIAPFYLWPDRERPWMDGVRAIAQWRAVAKEMQIKCVGYVFRPRAHFDNVNPSPDVAMSSESFLECFRNNMVDIGIDPRPYGMHSFRRGGCQYLAMVLRWPIRNICAWGGWAENFDNPGTIFRYLLSWVDSPTVDRKDYFNPHRVAADPCTACGRTCHCS